jgi:hypothetical protein
MTLKIAIFAAALALAPLAAHADTYNYTGAALASIAYTINGPVVTAIPGVTGSATISNDALTSYDFTVDGLTFDTADSKVNTDMISAGSNGQINGYTIQLTTEANGYADTLNLVNNDGYGLGGDSISAYNGNFTSFTPGSFGDTTPPVAAAVTPEPSSLLLLGTGAIGLAGTVRRRILRA